MRKRVLRLVLVLLVLWLPVSVVAQDGPSSDGASSSESKAPALQQGLPKDAAERLAKMSRTLDEAQRELRSNLITEQRLSFWREELSRVRKEAQAISEAANARVESVRSLLEALGPPPEEGTEPAPVANERGKLNRELERYVALQKQAELIMARVDERRQDLLGTQRTRFTEQLLQKGPSVLRAETWRVAANDLLEATQRAAAIFVNAPTQTGVTRSWRDALPLNIAMLAVAIVLGWPLRIWLLRRYGRDLSMTDPTYMQRLVAAVIEGVVRALVPAIAAWSLYFVLNSQGLLVGLVEVLASSIATSVTFFSLVYGLTKAALAPNAPNWRVIAFTDDCALKLGRMLIGLAAFLAIDAVFFRLGAAMELTAELAVVHSTLVGTVVMVLVLRMLAPDFWRRDPGAMTAGASAGEATSGGPAGETSMLPGEEDDDDNATAGDIGRTLGLILTLLIGLIAVAIPVVSALGYFTLGRFLTTRLIMSGLLVAGLVLLRGLAHELAAYAFNPGTRPGARMRKVLGLSDEGLERLRLWLLIPGDLLLLAGGGLLALALWGVNWDVIGSWLSTLLFGLQLGGITISLLDIALASAVFFVALALTRFIQRLMNRQVFRQINMDVGVRHSLNAATGYVGLIIAFLLSISALGLDLSNLAIIAGALSVGIGFGLQTIVNNFVSGIILLAERPVKVGDWVVVGEYEGFVKKINVRATELETFDRSYVIVPNSQLVSSAVTNWTHRNRQCRLIIPVRVPYGTDTQHIHDMLMRCAREHRDILRWPAPHVLFRDFSESGLVFELRCYARDVDYFLSAPSELRFTIDRRLREAGIRVPLSSHDLYVHSMPWPETRPADVTQADAAPANGPGAPAQPSRSQHPPGPAGQKVPSETEAAEGE